jgi:alkylated DNA repair dioxygenase AlkB
MSQADLFSVQQELPNGLLYRPDFITIDEERDLIAHIGQLPFREARFREYTARRRVVRFGGGDTLESDPNQESDFPRIEFPRFLQDIRARIADWLGCPPADFVHGLVTEYAPGTPIGWHRDAPHFDIVVGISLASACRMRYRAYADKGSIFGIDLAPRSLYVMKDDIRWQWEHSIAPVKDTRYSITLRTRVDDEIRYSKR